MNPSFAELLVNKVIYIRSNKDRSNKDRLSLTVFLINNNAGRGLVFVMRCIGLGHNNHHVSAVIKNFNSKKTILNISSFLTILNISDPRAPHWPPPLPHTKMTNT